MAKVNVKDYNKQCIKYSVLWIILHTIYTHSIKCVEYKYCGLDKT